MKKKLFLVVLSLLFIFTLFSCNKETENVEEKTYNISYEASDYYSVDVKTSAKEKDEVNVSIKINEDYVIIDDVYYNEVKTDKLSFSDNIYKCKFVMPSKDVNLVISYSFREKLEDEYAKFSSEDKVIYLYDSRVDSILTEKRELNVSFNMNHMTILNSDIKSLDESVIPNEAIEVKEILNSDIVGSSGSNVIEGAKILIDSHKIKVGKTFLKLEFKNGNVSNQKSNLIVEVEVKSKEVYGITYNKDDNYEVSIREYASFTEVVYFTVTPKNAAYIIKNVSSLDVEIIKEENVYKFNMPKKDVNIMIEYEIKEILSDDFASYNDDKEIYMFNELLDFSTFYNRYLTVDFSEEFSSAEAIITSTNQKVIPSEALDFQAEISFGKVISLDIMVDSKLIREGETTLICKITADQKTATIIFNLKVLDRLAYKINTSSDEFAALSIAKGAIPNTKVYFSFKPSYHFVNLIEITSKDVEIVKSGENSYSFIMPENEVTINYQYELVETTEDSIADLTSFSRRIKVFDALADTEENRYVQFKVDFNASYMTICNMTVKASNKDIIDEDAFTKKDILDMDIVGSSGSNEVVGAYIYLDRTKIREGETYLIFEFKNGNVSREKATLLIKVNFIK